MFGTVFEISASFFQSCMTVWFITRFNKKPYFRSAAAILFSLIQFGATLLSDYFLPGFSLLSVVILFALSLLYALMICEKAYARAILSTCMIHTLTILSSTLMYTVISSLINDFDTVMQGSDSVIRYVYVVIVNLFVFITAKLILGLFNVDKSLNIKTSLVMFLASLLTLIGLGATTKIAELDGNIKAPVIALTVIFVTINIILYALVGQIQKLQQKKSELMLINERLSFEQNRINDANAMLDTCRKIKHDMKQHLTVIGGYLDDGRTDECREYVKDLYSSADRIGNIIQSGNTVIDYLINAKLGHLQDTQVIVSGNVGDLSDISDVDLSCMIGNILDNAVEAVRPLKDKRIELTFATQGENRIIICRNTVEGPVLERNRFLTSTKNNAKEHGLGHKIVASVVESYDGIVSYFEEDGMFGTQVILPRGATTFNAVQNDHRASD